LQLGLCQQRRRTLVAIHFRINIIIIRSLVLLRARILLWIRVVIFAQRWSLRSLGRLPVLVLWFSFLLVFWRLIRRTLVLLLLLSLLSLILLLLKLLIIIIRISVLLLLTVLLVTAIILEIWLLSLIVLLGRLCFLFINTIFPSASISLLMIRVSWILICCIRIVKVPSRLDLMPILEILPIGCWRIPSSVDLAFEFIKCILVSFIRIDLIAISFILGSFFFDKFLRLTLLYHSLADECPWISSFDVTHVQTPWIIRLKEKTILRRREWFFFLTQFFSSFYLSNTLPWRTHSYLEDHMGVQVTAAVWSPLVVLRSVSSLLNQRKDSPLEAWRLHSLATFLLFIRECYHWSYHLYHLEGEINKANDSCRNSNVKGIP